MLPLGGLERLPLLTVSVTEEVRVPGDHLRLEPPVDRVGVERAGLLGHDDLEREVEEEVAQLPLELPRRAFPDRVHHLVGFLEEMGNERLRGLRPVPGAFGPQEAHEGEGAVE